MDFKKSLIQDMLTLAWQCTEQDSTSCYLVIHTGKGDIHCKVEFSNEPFESEVDHEIN